jgi:ADP-L-glycero-D-manno-heptose 6-epimerase
MIVITGAEGFIASVVIGRLNQAGYTDLAIVDSFTRPDRTSNYINKKFREKISREAFLPWFSNNASDVQAVIHLGARTDTMEADKGIFDELNLHYSQAIWRICTQYQIPLIYASSAATYGDGQYGFDDDHSLLSKLQPLNEYAKSKHSFDLWALNEQAAGNAPFFWAGLKFFNVYGPNEYHKGRMASVVFHATNQVLASENHSLKLFKSYKSDIQDGCQMRDFIYVKDVANVILHLLEQRPQPSAIYNLGSGKARTFLDLAHAVYHSLGIEPNIEFIDMPPAIIDSYQYFTQASMNKLVTTGYNSQFYSLEEGIANYVSNYLLEKKHY